MASFFQKIFRRENISDESNADKSPNGEDTQPLKQKVSSNLEVEAPPATKLNPPQMLVGSGHSVGKQRDHNEDALFTLTTTLVTDSHRIPFGLFIVADGMGGHKHGEMASGIAIRAMANHVISKLYTPMIGIASTTPEESLQEIMQAGVQTAHKAIVKGAPGGGTTLTAVLIVGNQMTTAHVGDSRAYAIYADETLEVLTRDHSLVKRLEELGQITADEAAIHPQRNVLYRALGQGEPFDAEISTHSLPSSGHLMVCSDGLWGLVNEDEIVTTITTTDSPALAAQKLVEAANEAGGPDNISAIIVRLPE